MPYITDPVHFFGEIFRVLEPKGTATVSWVGGATSSISDGELRAFEIAHQTFPWRQAADAAELLYMTGSFFRYSGAWQKLRVQKLVPEDIFVVTGTKMSDRALQMLRIERVRSIEAVTSLRSIWPADLHSALTCSSTSMPHSTREIYVPIKSCTA